MSKLTMGEHLLLFFRDHNKQETEDGSKLKFQTEHSISKEKETESIWTKDGMRNTVSDGSNTVSISAYAYRDDDGTLGVLGDLEELFDSNKRVEIWEVDLDSEDAGKYNATYFQGYFTSFERTAGDSAVEVSIEYAIDGKGVKGTDLLTEEQLGAINSLQYEYQSIKALGTGTGGE